MYADNDIGAEYSSPLFRWNNLDASIPWVLCDLIAYGFLGGV